jgi:hypothetical protein
MSFKEIRDKEKELSDSFLKMSNEEYDKYMCSKYPDFFKNRNLPMTETCMCWGFSIGKGWYSVLDKACRYAKLIKKVTGIGVVFEQIKEKYGSARFYNCEEISEECKLSEEEQYLWYDIISNIISDAERKTEHTCAECGEEYYHKHICIGSSVYDVCDECFVKLHPDRLDQFNRWKKLSSLNGEFGWVLNYLDESELASVKEVIEKCKKRLEERNK